MKRQLHQVLPEPLPALNREVRRGYHEMADEPRTLGHGVRRYTADSEQPKEQVAARAQGVDDEGEGGLEVACERVQHEGGVGEVALPRPSVSSCQLQSVAWNGREANDVPSSD